MFLRDRFDDEQSQSSSLYMSHGSRGQAMKTFEDSLKVVRFNAHSMILHAQNQLLLVRCLQPDPHIDLLPRIFDRVIEHVRHCSSQILGAAFHVQPAAIAT